MPFLLERSSLSKSVEESLCLVCFLCATIKLKPYSQRWLHVSVQNCGVFSFLVLELPYFLKSSKKTHEFIKQLSFEREMGKFPKHF